MKSTKRFSLNRLAALLAPLLAACGDPDPSEPPGMPPGVPGVYVTGVVRDPGGTPVPQLTVIYEAWPLPDSVQQPGAGTNNSVLGMMRTDSEGRFATHVGYYNVWLLDSLQLRLMVDGCWGSAPVTIHEEYIPVAKGAPDTVLDVALTLSRAAPRARLAVGPACAAMVVPAHVGMEERFGLWIDEVSDSIRGRWLINYQESRGSEYGHFSGWREGNSVTLDLRLDSPWDAGPPGGLCSRYTLELAVEAGDTLGPGTYQPVGGCLAVPGTLRFFEHEFMSWPFP